jgi:hypothetical protein
MCPIKTGVELELWVVDSDGSLADGQDIVPAHERIEPEFIDPLVEVQTKPHENEFALRRDLQSTLLAGVRAADRENKRLVPLGTPLTAAEADANCKRGRLFEAIYGEGIQSAKNCAGTHIHFEQASVVDQLNLLTAVDPALALVSSSPYYCGQNGGDSSRAHAYRRECGQEFRKFCDLWPYADSRQQWENRIDRVYEQFQTLAVERGIGPETVAAFFEPDDTVLNPVRLRTNQPTVEWRAPDAALPNEVIDLAVDVGALIAKIETRTVEYGEPGLQADRIGLPEFSTLRELGQQAIGSGLESTAVRRYLRKMGFDPSKYQPFAPEIDGPESIGESAARELRLEQADRLENDLTMIAA